MNISFDKQISSLEREILLKSVEIHDSGDDFQFELNKFFSQKEIIAIAPRCIRCNMCVDQCPVDAIEPANIFKIAKITPDCVKCEICVQTCPVSAIKLIDNKVSYNHDEGDEAIEYNLASISRPHRVVRMNDIFIDLVDRMMFVQYMMLMGIFEGFWDILIELSKEDGVEGNLSQPNGIRRGSFIHKNIGKEIVNKEAWMYKIHDDKDSFYFLANKRTIHIEKNEGKSEVYGIAYPKEDIGLFEKEIVTE